MNLQINNGLWHSSVIVMALGLLTGFWPVYMYVSQLTPLLKLISLFKRPERSQVINSVYFSN